jgi:hypothetical protein
MEQRKYKPISVFTEILLRFFLGIDLPSFSAIYVMKFSVNYILCEQHSFSENTGWKLHIWANVSKRYYLGRQFFGDYLISDFAKFKIVVHP